MIFEIQIAGLAIKINSIHDHVRNMTWSYLTENITPDICISISEEEILKALEIEKNNTSSKKYLETLVVYRKIAEAVLPFDTFLMHGSVIATGNDAFMFTAQSGVGKTTRSRLWLEQLPGSYYVNGDKPLLKVQEKDVLACGTPWSGKENLNTNIMVPLRAIFILERAEQTTLEELKFSEAFVPLLQQTYRPSDPQLMVKTIRLLKQLDGKVKFYRYRSSLDDADMRMLYRAVMNQEPPADTGS